jgi:hypothetical protein
VKVPSNILYLGAAPRFINPDSYKIHDNGVTFFYPMTFHPNALKADANIKCYTNLDMKKYKLSLVASPISFLEFKDYLEKLKKKKEKYVVVFPIITFYLTFVYYFLFNFCNLFIF